MATTVELPKPDKKLLKQVEADNKAIKAKSIYKEEAPVAKDHKATSSDKKVKKLNK
jgi:hypothetical protein